MPNYPYVEDLHTPHKTHGKVLRDIYNSHGVLFAASGRVVDVTPSAIPGTVFVDNGGYSLMTFAKDVEIIAGGEE